MTIVGAYPIGRRQPRGKACTHRVEAPFNGAAATHQCSGVWLHDTPAEEGHNPGTAYWHYCGCGYEWGDSGLIIRIPKGEK